MADLLEGIYCLGHQKGLTSAQKMSVNGQRPQSILVLVGMVVVHHYIS